MGTLLMITSLIFGCTKKPQHEPINYAEGLCTHHPFLSNAFFLSLTKQKGTTSLPPNAPWVIIQDYDIHAGLDMAQIYHGNLNDVKSALLEYQEATEEDFNTVLVAIDQDVSVQKVAPIIDTILSLNIESITFVFENDAPLNIPPSPNLEIYNEIHTKALEWPLDQRYYMVTRDVFMSTTSCSPLQDLFDVMAEERLEKSCFTLFENIDDALSSCTLESKDNIMTSMYYYYEPKFVPLYKSVVVDTKSETLQVNRTENWGSLADAVLKSNGFAGFEISE